MNWIKGPNYDYPEGFPRYLQTLWWDLKCEKEFGDKQKIPKELMRRRWIPGTTTFMPADKGEGYVEVDLTKGDHMPIRTINWIIRHDKMLKRIRKTNE